MPRVRINSRPGGNTSPDSGGSQSNGGMVCRKTRYARDVSAVKRVRL